MTAQLLTDLAWLPRPPADFRARAKALIAAPAGSIGHDLRYLATHALNGNQLTDLARAIARLRDAGVDLKPLAPLRLGIVSNATTGLLAPALVGSAARHGFALDCVETEFNQGLQAALDPQSTLNTAKPDVVLLAVTWRGLPLQAALGDAAAAAQAIAQSIGYLMAIADAIGAHSGATVIFETLARPPEALFGSYDLRVPGTARHLVDGFNRALAERLCGTPHLLFDVAALAENVGLADWHDSTLWYAAKLAFSLRMLPLYADHVARLLASLRGKGRRCLVLDLDNTLWSGVIGDDGLEGIVIGEGSAVGEAHLETQRVALKLRERGIVLAVSSKNDDAIARRALREHPDMLVKEDHVAVFQINWQDKASNIEAIAGNLALGLESIVLLDDNPVEREQVRQALPEVAVPELPADPALHARCLMASGYFEAVAFSDEDRVRADYYQANAARSVLIQQSGDLDAFHRSLDMTITFAPFDAIGRERIAQLIVKSNQFNLTTRRYTATGVAALEGAPGVFTLQVRLSDKFGDNGMICVVVCRADGEAWEIDTWLMSCRVLGRRVEEAVLHEIARHARQAGATMLRGRYIPTARNALVRDHYAKLGFQRVEESADGGSVWTLDLADLQPVDLPMQVVRRAGASASSTSMATA
ncbi:MAG TPA: HAD-IIIC family phosphatase [Pseudolabrys sp.]|nr:HAD-IIIC family phosphatase [Pseudolabrys sp.]